MSKNLAERSSVSIKISSKKVAIALFGLVAILAVLHLITQYVIFFYSTGSFTTEILTRFDMNNEISIPTWFSQILLLLSAVIFAYIAYVKFSCKDKYRFHWLSLGFLFTYLSIDEGAELHETLGILDIANSLGLTSTFFGFAWVLPAMLIVLVLGALFFRFWLQLPNRTKVLFVLAIGLFLSGALGIEMISADYLAQVQADGFTYNGVLVLFEEGLEMLGVVTLIYALLSYASEQKTLLSVNITR